MKKVFSLFVTVIMLFSFAQAVSASEVTYNGNSGDFVFTPGSDYSPTDLFSNFKSVMPGDNITQEITVKNEADKKVKVKIYMRSIGAHDDSVEFLSKLGLKVAKSEENKMAYMFDAAANETAGLTDWVCLGTLYSGGEVNLDVTLNVPVELPNDYQNKIGYLDWEFMIEEFPVEPDDPKPPKTDDNSNIGLWFTVMICSLVIFIILLVWRKKNKQTQKNAVER